jgi:alpha-D-glucose phosphate-specific phosphoglucomutase
MIKFGTDGWRAIIADEFTFDRVYVVAKAIGNYLKEKKRGKGKGIFVGYDTRFLADEFGRVSAHALREEGLDVKVSPSFIPTPVTAFCVKHFNLEGAVMITASHNPPMYCGIKFIPHYAGPAFPEITSSIEKFIGNLEAKTSFSLEMVKADFPSLDPFPEYKSHLISLVDKEAIKRSGLKVVLDPSFGAGISVFEEIFKPLGVETVVINNYRDPYFGGDLPDPSPKRLKKLADVVKRENAQLGLSLDGDGDRFGVVDEEGNIFNTNEMLSIIAYHLLKNKNEKGTLVRTVATTHLLDRIASSFGVGSKETPVGFKYIAREMLEDNVLLGGEESGGLSLGKHLPEKDGLLASLLVAEVYAYEKKPLGKVLKEIWKKFGQLVSRRWDMPFPSQKRNEVVKLLKKELPSQISGRKVEEVRRIDGVKAIFSDGSWFLMRPSGTEPLVRVYVESSSQEAVEEIASFALNYLSIHEEK